MSIKDIAWVFDQTLKPSSLKFLCVVLANFTDSYGMFWPSVDTLVRITGQNRKTIISGINELERLGLIQDSGGRKGKTNSVKVYYFNAPHHFEEGKNKAVPKTEHLKQSQNYQEAVPFLPESSTENGNSPTPPIKKEPLLIQKRNIKAEKYTLAPWEEKQGCRFNNSMVSSWANENKIAPALLLPLIDEFRDRVQAGGNVYSDFVAAFKVWIRKGWLSQSIEQLQQRSRKATQQVLFSEKGVSL